MEFICFIFMIATLAFDVVIFIEIEKILDNTFENGNALARINRFIIKSSRKVKK